MTRRLHTWGIALLLGAALLTGCGGDAPTSRALPTAAAPPAASALPGERLDLAAPDVRALAYAPGGEQVALGSGRTIWITTSELAPLRALEGHTAPVRALAWSPDGTRLASAALDGTARVWDPATGAALVTLSGHADWVMGVAWSADGARLVTGSTDGTVRLWGADGAPITVLGATRVERVNIQLNDPEVFTALQDLRYARLVLDGVDGEPLADLTRRVRAAGYRLPVTFADPALADRLLALRAQAYSVRVVVDNAALQEELDALDQPALTGVVNLLDDPSVDETIQQLNDAEATLTALEARDDADLLRTVRDLRRQEVVVVIQRADGQTTTVPPDQDFVATLLDLRGEDFTLSLQLADQAELAAKLHDPDFLHALEQLETASATLTAFNERDDAREIRLVRALRAADEVTIRLETPDPALTADLAALDRAGAEQLIALLQDEALLAALAPLAAAGDDLSRLPDHNTAAALRALAPLGPSVALHVEDDALAGEVAALDEAGAAHLIALLEDRVFLHMLGARDGAAEQVAELEARPDFPFIEAMAALGGPTGVDVRITWLAGAERATVARKVTPEKFVLALVPQTEDVIHELSRQSDAAAVKAISQIGPDALAAQIAAGDYALEPALDPAAQQLVLERLSRGPFRVAVQREANGHSGGVTGVAWSPDGARIVSAGTDGTLRLWEPDSGRLLAVLQGKDSISALAWGPDPARFASANWDKTGAVWQVSADGTSAEPSAALDTSGARIQALAWAPDGAALVGGSRAGALTIWDAASGDAQAKAAPGAEIWAVAWSPDGASLLSGGADGVVRLWSVEDLRAGE